jgi:hypothetical protein
MSNQVNENIVDGSFMSFSSDSIAKQSIQKSFLLHNMLNDSASKIRSVQTENIVKQDKEEEASDITNPDTLIYPDAVMIESTYTNVAHSTVFGSCRFIKFACSTNQWFCRKQDSIGFKELHMGTVIFLGHNTWVL